MGKELTLCIVLKNNKRDVFIEKLFVFIQNRFYIVFVQC